MLLKPNFFIFLIKFLTTFPSPLMALQFQFSVLRHTSNLSLNAHITQIAKSTSKKMGILFCCWRFISSEKLLHLYKLLIYPGMKCYTHIWGSFNAANLLNRIKSKVLQCMNSLNLTSKLNLLSLHHAAGSLSLFYRYYFWYLHPKPACLCTFTVS